MKKPTTYKTPNTAIARHLIQYLPVGTTSGYTLEFVYTPTIANKAKISTLLLAKLLDIYKIKGKQWQASDIWIDLAELQELGIVDPHQGNARNIYILNQCVKSITSARLVKRTRGGGEEAYNLFSCQLPLILNSQVKGYVLLVSDKLPTQGLYRHALASYGILPTWCFDLLSADGFLLAYYLITHQALAKRCSYYINFASILDALPTFTTRTRTSRTPRARLIKAIQEITATEGQQDNLRIYQDTQNPENLNIIVSKIRKNSLKKLV